MIPLPILDLIAGMIFIYFLMSVISNSIFESLSAIGGIRANMLEKWIKANLPDIAEHFLDHTLVNGLSKPGKSTAYLSAANFYSVLIDAIAKNAGTVPKSLDEISTALENFKAEKSNVLPEELMRSLQYFIVEAKQAGAKADQIKTELEFFRSSVENWFDSMMERVGGSYKRKASVYTFVIALLATFALNMDSISISKYLYSNKEARDQLAVAAYKAPGDSTNKALVKQMRTIDSTTTKTHDSASVIITKVTKAVNKVDSTSSYVASFIPIGWNCKAEYQVFSTEHKGLSESWKKALYCLLKVFGLFITVFAVCLGAPFWFDVLGKVANLRNSIKPASAAGKQKKSN